MLFTCRFMLNVKINLPPPSIHTPHLTCVKLEDFLKEMSNSKPLKCCQLHMCNFYSPFFLIYIICECFVCERHKQKEIFHSWWMLKHKSKAQHKRVGWGNLSIPSEYLLQIKYIRKTYARCLELKLSLERSRWNEI